MSERLSAAGAKIVESLTEFRDALKGALIGRTKRTRIGPEFEPPAYLLRAMPDNLPEDPLGREIALLLHENPECSLRVFGGDLDAMDDDTKAILLGDIKRMLGIRTVRTRRLGYVGPEGDDIE